MLHRQNIAWTSAFGVFRVSAVRIVLLIVASGTVSTPAYGQSATLTLFDPANRAPTSIDPNGFLLDPQWLGRTRVPNIERDCRFRASTGQLEHRSLWITRAHCLSAAEDTLVSLNEAAATLGLGGVCGTSGQTGNLRGHLNWFPVTVAGRLEWLGYSGGSGGDHDITMRLVPQEAGANDSSPHALTSGNRRDDKGRRGYEIEFYHSETLLRLPAGSSWWHQINRVLTDATLTDSMINALLTPRIKDRYAIVTGTYGLDAVHEYHAELHPVFAMAVLVSDSTEADGAHSERWALMVRNRGGEGDCSVADIPMYTSAPSAAPGADRPTQHFVFEFPWLPSASDASVAIDSSWSTTPKPNISYRVVHAAAGNHIFVDIEHPRPVPGQADFLFLGEVRVRWRVARGGALVLSGRRAQFGDIRLDRLQSLHAEAAPIRDLWRQTREPSVERTQRPPYSRLLPVTFLAPDVIGGIDSSWHAADAVVVYKSPLWVSEQPVETVSCKSHRLYALCRGKWRFLVAPLERTGTGEWTIGGVSALLYAHSWTWPEQFADLSEWLSAISYRFDLHRDEYRMSPRFGGDRHDGGSLRLTMIHAPNTFRLSDQVAITPYYLVSPGVSVLREQRSDAAFTFSSGFGVDMQGAAGSDWFVEVQRFSRAHHSDGYFAFTLGCAFRPKLLFPC